jgi:hypothetical protein
MSRAAADRLRARADAARVALLPLSVPSTANRCDARLDRAAIERFISILGIRHPVVVTWTPFPNDRRGDHLWQRGRYHRIRVAFDVPARQLAATLVHELVHAAQSEGYPSHREWRAAYDRETDLHGYGANRFERACREIAAQFSRDFRLAS